MKISKVKIERFRSISCLELNIDQTNNLISICGQNNVGKTNALRAINLFFNPQSYDKANDMTTLKQATGGGSTHPKITITFYDSITGTYDEIVRDMAHCEDGTGLSGTEYKLTNGGRKKESYDIDEQHIDTLLAQFEFVYIESINIIIPELINDITEDVIDEKFQNAKFTKSKKDLKDSYDEYIEGLREILDSFAIDISATFKEFQPMWSVKFDVPQNSDSFRELISSDVTLKLDDSGSIGIEDKGAGLQRLAAILLQFELLARKKNKNKMNIVCIDEPDVYIHEGLQQKLKIFLDSRTENTQIFLTTHSKVFLNRYSMKNVFLFDANYRIQYSARKKEILMLLKQS